MLKQDSLLDCPDWKTNYVYSDDYYYAIVKEDDCSKTEQLSKWVMDSPAMCQLACISDEKCIGFTFQKPFQSITRRWPQACSLYNASGVRRGEQKRLHISGMRDSCVRGKEFFQRWG